jgi:hypothetical protein
MAKHFNIKNKKYHTILRTLAVSVALALSTHAQASGGDGMGENGYAPEHYVPRQELVSYGTGNVGVLPGSYWRVYHFMAYRAISGNPLAEADVKRLNIDRWRVDNKEKINHFKYENSNGLMSWLAARTQVKGAKPVKAFETFGPAGGFASYERCPVDAFNRAAATLAERQKTATEAQLKVWLEGQDAVFQNCDPPPPWPASKIENDPAVKVILAPALPGDAPLWLQQDHEYQIAAAHFYAEKFDEARRRFQAIAGNKASPWQSLAPYLAARCLVRKATLFPDANELSTVIAADRKKREALLAEARTELAALATSYPPAAQLLSYVEGQAQPVARVRALGAILATAKIDATTPQLLTDYIMLLNGGGAEALTVEQANDKLSDKDPMTTWIGLMQAGVNRATYDDGAKLATKQQGQAIKIARARWLQSKKNAIWLLPLLANMGKNFEQLTAEEQSAIANVAESTALFQPLQYEMSRLLIADGRLDEADEIVNRVLLKLQTQKAHSIRNRWLELKVATAKTEAEFFRALPRVYADTNAPTPIPNESTDRQNTAQQFDDDYYDRVYHDFPLPELLRLSQHTDFPTSDQRRTIKQAIFTRAVALGDFDTAIAHTDGLAVGRVTTRHLYERFKKAQTTEEKQIAAALVLANTPEFTTEVVERDYNSRFRNCSIEGSTDNETGVRELQLPACARPLLNFQQADVRESARREQLQLRKWGRGADYILSTLSTWAKEKPTDAELPKALHFYITSKRAPTKQSKEAFQLLHKQFAGSEWAKKTKYFY